ncbi:hypothetical protein ACFW1A_16010 [Kitasatospora sp. NPDC058965]|uniref:hypothetical protein n=1 Tax=Kitasatospora sp. NPDC058965 TaxID=3346682 RepID=UPI0036A946C4
MTTPQTCPGVGEYGHGLTGAVVHWGCCPIGRGKPTSSPLPHDPYITAVDTALTAAAIGCDDGWTSEADEHDHDGNPTLSAVFTWHADNTALDTDLFVHGAGVYWALTSGWEYAAMRLDGSNDIPSSLPLPLWAEPADVVQAVRSALVGLPLPPQPAREWLNTDVATAVEAWAAE